MVCRRANGVEVDLQRAIPGYEYVWPDRVVIDPVVFGLLVSVQADLTPAG